MIGLKNYELNIDVALPKTATWYNMVVDRRNIDVNLNIEIAGKENKLLYKITRANHY
jgi:hypothetical protein